MSDTDRTAPTSAAIPSAKRLAFLETLVESGGADSFARYGLAMEYRKAGRVDDALSAFLGLRKADPKYVPQYLMAGQMLLDAGRHSEAREWLEEGMARARAAGDSRALGELEDALAVVP